ncbi:MAG: GTPase domain-containing protein [Deltaproteobacteria bacterium]|nr:GTPase domain-containing protein [Deltaproteobacteria bacterium]MBW2017111.1 GTPase domain-containing protein [Deltaproteobacteria bacterium]MBW2129875.1 GTPase domain-containing protein [Deltaproteobacteria bacterium]MBW2303112.1 GTPase domain-containing protein [Deltaproteobacteria bacterium]
MAKFNPRDRVIECKIVYYGPGRGGKTTNLEYIFKAFNKNTTAEMVSINTRGDRTLYFDFLPMGLGKIRGCEVKIQLYTVPGQTRYRSTRKLVLKGVDGIVFVADSLAVRRKANLLSLKDLQENLKEQNMNLFNIPLVLQYNKRDLARDGIPLIPLEVMEKDLNSKLKVPSFPASALKGTGVGTTLKQCLLLTLRHLQKELRWTR